uniref:Solute carrier family 12 member 9 n=1 Tax=Panagrellus redivivus TaxID=6233 RepID=A0A7E4VP44_PANRE
MSADDFKYNQRTVTSLSGASDYASKTMERPPKIDFYTNSNLARPSIVELMRGGTDGVRDDTEHAIGRYEDAHAEIVQLHMKPEKGSKKKDERSIESGNKVHPIDEKSLPKAENENATKFGWIEGVLVRCIANIFGVMLYLRMAWVAGQAGILFGTLIVLLGSLVTLITTLSMSAICTNGMVKGGGVYYLISRSLGPEFGGSIGILFSLANAFGAAMYIVGLAETVISRLNEWGFSLIDGGVNDVRILGLVVCALLVVIIFVGLGFEAKMQVVLLFVVLGSIIDFYVGSFFRPNGEKQAMGVTGFKSPTFFENLYPDYRNGYNFFSVFSIYFPAATGIMAGANISGDLKNPASAIPKGTIIAITLTTIVYISFIWITGCTVVRDANGLDVPVLLNSTILANFDNKDWSSEVFAALFGAPQQYYAKPDCISDNSCKYGLMNYFQVVELISAIYGKMQRSSQLL